MGNCYYDANVRFVQTEYGRQPTFSSFLPGIAGPRGIPTWCNYNNRGQAVCSFGVQDKDHAILEFTAAAAAYQRTPLTGFRTFLKENGKVTEAFADGLGTMTVEPNALAISWRDSLFAIEVTYFSLPNERMAGLCRRVRLKNISPKAVETELLDGLAAMVPYGISDEKLKQEPQLSTAWMQVEDLEENLPYYRVRASMEDTAKVTAVRGGNFKLAFAEGGRLLKTIVQPSLIFGWDTSMVKPANFEEHALSEITSTRQLTENFLPCAFTPWAGTVQPGEALTLWEFYGQAEEIDQMRSFCQKAGTAAYFEEKLKQARMLAEEITAPVRCRTADPVFDGYVAQNFLDNVMRGGLPYHIGDCKRTPPVYLYSRKHGDPEREYNYFSLGREYFSQGNANFRDICQNRRSDVLIDPDAGMFNIRLFFELLQPDGYNPLVLMPVSYQVRDPEKLIKKVGTADQDRAREILSGPFSIGRLAMEAENWKLDDIGDFLAAVVAASEVEPNAVYQEGYWCDHWTYLLDLIESQLSVFPDQERALLFGVPQYRWYAGQASVRPQPERFCMTENGLRQYHCVQAQMPGRKWTQTRDGTAVSNLAEKLILLCAVKYATLDLSGAAIEMEGGKPGWYDAMNGLPGLLGSSVADGCELLRILDFLLERKRIFPDQIEVYEEIANLLKSLYSLEKAHKTAYEKWVERNRLRDRYRAQVQNGFSGRRTALRAEETADILNCLAASLRQSIARETEENGGICPTYFYYEAESIRPVKSGILPGKMRKSALPLFLEGPTRWMRTRQTETEKRSMSDKVRDSALLDRSLNMYKLNESLENVSFEVGRTRAFPRGWLENESIWVHMEYKYLLALLACGNYDRFFTDFTAMVIPFLSPETYGRSTLENSSFLVSSINSDSASHGRGFVSRLSGSTAEFISIWNWMLFGKAPFGLDDDGLYLSLCPAIPARLLPEDGKLMGTFLGKVPVVYHAANLEELRPGAYRITGYQICDGTGTAFIAGSKVPAEWAKQIRNGGVLRLEVSVEPI